MYEKRGNLWWWELGHSSRAFNVFGHGGEVRASCFWSVSFLSCEAWQFDYENVPEYLRVFYAMLPRASKSKLHRSQVLPTAASHGFQPPLKLYYHANFVLFASCSGVVRAPLSSGERHFLNTRHPNAYSESNGSTV